MDAVQDDRGDCSRDGDCPCRLVAARALAAAPSRKNLVLIGKVSSITQGQDVLKPWIVTLDVMKVVSGEFSGEQFRFAIHSPPRSGLEVGQSYMVKAVWNGQGYEVDEHQWRGGKKGSSAPPHVEWASP